MKWFKHMTASHDDEKLAALMDSGRGGESGLALYGLYWLTLEIVAGQLEKNSTDPSAKYSISKWSRMLGIRGSLVESKLLQVALTLQWRVTRDDSEIQVTIPNLLKYRDEYSRKSGHYTETVRTKEGEEDTEGDREKKEKEKKEKISEAIEVLPGWMPMEAWEGWLEVRRVKKDRSGRVVPWTKRCAKIAIGQLERWRVEGYDPIAILDAATAGNWQGLHLPDNLKPSRKWRAGDPNSAADWAAARHPEMALQ